MPCPLISPPVLGNVFPTIFMRSLCEIGGPDGIGVGLTSCLNTRFSLPNILAFGITARTGRVGSKTLLISSAQKSHFRLRLLREHDRSFLALYLRVLLLPPVRRLRLERLFL